MLLTCRSVPAAGATSAPRCSRCYTRYRYNEIHTNRMDRCGR
jgi:hypothetical protein